MGSVSRPLIHRGGAHLSSPPVVSHCHHGQEEGIHDPGEEEEAPYSPQEEGCRGTQEGAGEEGRGTSPGDRRAMWNQGRPQEDLPAVLRQVVQPVDSYHGSEHFCTMTSFR